jgi:hypothetical protein
MRCGEQVFEVPVPLDGLVLTASNLWAEAETRFHRRHEELFTYVMPGQDIVLANARLAVTGCLPALHRHAWVRVWPPNPLALAGPGWAACGSTRRFGNERPWQCIRR